jgi:hypothetical protein
MANRDAFGREKGEDPLAALGWSKGTSAKPVSGAASSDPERVAVVVAQSITHFPTNVPGGKGGPVDMPGMPGTGGGRSLWGILKWFIPLLLLGAIVAIALSAGGDVKDAMHSVKSVFISATKTSSDEAGYGATSAHPPAGTILEPGPDGVPVPIHKPAGFAPGSLLLKSNFNRGLRRLSTVGSQLATIRVAADRIDASIVTKDGRRKQVQVDWKGYVKVLSTSGPGFGHDNSFRTADLFRAAPFRLSRSAAGRSRRPAADVDYLVAFHFAGLGHGVMWSAFIKTGDQYSADPRGRITHKIN